MPLHELPYWAADWPARLLWTLALIAIGCLLIAAGTAGYERWLSPAARRR